MKCLTVLISANFAWHKEYLLHFITGALIFCDLVLLSFCLWVKMGEFGVISRYRGYEISFLISEFLELPQESFQSLIGPDQTILIWRFFSTSPWKRVPPWITISSLSKQSQALFVFNVQLKRFPRCSHFERAGRCWYFFFFGKSVVDTLTAYLHLRIFECCSFQ